MDMLFAECLSADVSLAEENAASFGFLKKLHVIAAVVLIAAVSVVSVL